MKVLAKNKTEEYYQALLNRDSRYIGIFFVGVKTTSVFCISVCRARKPKKENVTFFSTFKEALSAGYRPCKICKPTENANQAPEQVQKAVKLVKDHPNDRISDARLKELGISPDVLRRWFKQHYGLTFHAFQRMYRINNARKELRDGRRTTDTAFESGYESLSGFGYTYKKLIGNAPSQKVGKKVILINRFSTPIGPMFVCATEQGICLLEFTDRKLLAASFKNLQKRLDAEMLIGENDHIVKAKTELSAYFKGECREFTVPIQMEGTSFQCAVWEQLRQIGFGTTKSYGALADQLENPHAHRAVARANGQNRIAIIIPCHRVIGKNGRLTGYAGGLERKRWLLDLERKVVHQERL